MSPPKFRLNVDGLVVRGNPPPASTKKKGKVKSPEFQEIVVSKQVIDAIAKRIGEEVAASVAAALDQKLQQLPAQPRCTHTSVPSRDESIDQIIAVKETTEDLSAGFEELVDETVEEDEEVADLQEKLRRLRQGGEE